jgi:hypothetical protein
MFVIVAVGVIAVVVIVAAFDVAKYFAEFIR